MSFRLRHSLITCSLAGVLTACGGSGDDAVATVVPEPASAPPAVAEPEPDSTLGIRSDSATEPAVAIWHLQTADAEYAGELFRHYLLDGDPMIQLINADAVNFSLAYEGDPSGERAISNATFAAGRGPVCRQVGPASESSVRLEPSAPGWLSGTFSAMLGCPDYSLMRVEGSFTIEGPGE